jgi:hypothetical protein
MVEGQIELQDRERGVFAVGIASITRRSACSAWKVRPWSRPTSSIWS